MTDPQALDLETAAALRTLIFNLQDIDDPADVEDALAAARRRGVTADYCDSLRRAWTAWQERRVQVIGGAA